MNMRVAYLIIAHNEINILNLLIKILDYSGNTIFLMVDSKSSIRKKDIYCKLRFSELHIFDSDFCITWGGSSVIEAELFLLDKASLGNYDFYCLISGVDFPIKSQKYIHQFLTAHQNLEFIGVNEGWLKNNGKDYNIRLFHPFQNYIGKYRKVWSTLERIILKAQIPFVDRTVGSGIQFEEGPQWFCITDSFCKYVLNKKEWIRNTFYMTKCGDEIFIQTLLINSPFESKRYMPSSNCYEQCCRKIDWDRGKPYIWHSSDFEELMSSNALFARKFSEKVDMNIVKKISDVVVDGSL